MGIMGNNLDFYIDILIPDTQMSGCVKIGNGCKGCIYLKESNNGHKGKCSNHSPVTFFNPETRHWHCSSYEEVYIPKLRAELCLNYAP